MPASIWRSTTWTSWRSVEKRCLVMNRNAAGVAMKQIAAMSRFDSTALLPKLNGIPTLVMAALGMIC